MTKPEGVREGGDNTYKAEKRCCIVCDARKQCHVCGDATLFACSDCRIDFGVSIYVCSKSACRDEHETKCSFKLRERVEPKGMEGFEEQAREIITRIVTSCVRSMWTRNIEPLDNNEDADFPIEEELLVDALALALGDDIGCLDEQDENFRESVDLHWLENKLAAWNASRAGGASECCIHCDRPLSGHSENENYCPSELIRFLRWTPRVAHVEPPQADREP